MGFRSLLLRTSTTFDTIQETRKLDNSEIQALLLVGLGFSVMMVWSFGYLTCEMGLFALLMIVGSHSFFLPRAHHTRRQLPSVVGYVCISR